MNFAKTIEILKSGKIAVLPTDTLYGILGSALNQKTVEEIYKLKKRTPQKPLIILIADLKDLNLFEIELDEKTETFLEKVWPNPVSVILPCSNPRFEYLHRGTKTLAFRIPKLKWVQDLLRQTGPLIAPSANFEGEKPAENIKEARKYFGNKVDLYIEGGKLSGSPSTLIQIKNGQINILRQGVFKIPTLKLANLPLL